MTLTKQSRYTFYVVGVLVLAWLAGYFGGKAGSDGGATRTVADSGDSAKAAWVDRIKKAGVLRIGCADAPPTIVVKTDGTCTGPDLIPLENIADGIGVKVKTGQAVVRDGEYQDAWKDLRGQIGMIFHSYTLWPHMNVFDNLTVAPRLTLGESKAQLLDRAERALTDVGMAHHLRSRCTQLSGGERQRVAIARALMMRPRLLLCDEITSALDPPVAAEVLGVLTKLKEEEGIACGIVTHDMAFASKAADRICFFEDGLIKEDVPPEQAFNNPQTPGLRAFIDAVRF